MSDFAQKETSNSSAQIHAETLGKLREKWLRLADEQMAWSKESDARQDGANSHTERARARIYRECAADLEAGALSLRQGEQAWTSEPWAPIDTAPRIDGRVVLICYAAWAGPRVTTAIFRGSEVLDQTRAWYCDIGYVSATHWMPLPDPPPSVEIVPSVKENNQKETELRLNREK